VRVKWANFIHIYQPPTQKEIWVRRITNESYRKLFSGFLQLKQCKITVNVNSVLLELLEKWGGKDVIKDIRELLKQGKLELTGSAKYHPFLPLIPENEIRRQILLNEASLDKYFGKSWQKQGFFSPEMAYSDKVAKIAKEMGYQWIIIDEMGFPKDRKYRADKIYQIEDADNMNVFFRERELSFMISSAQIGTTPAIVKFLNDRLGKDEYAVTAMDGETFGHHRPGMEIFLFDLLSNPRIDTIKVSDLVGLFPEKESIKPRSSTWAVTEDDMKRGEPFARWKRKDNEIQQFQWELTNLAIKVSNRTPNNENLQSALDEAIHSDQFWWASARPWWSLEMIERGAYQLRQIVLSSTLSTDEEKTNAEEYYKNIMYTGFSWQRSGKVDEIARHENEDVLGRLHQKNKLFITKEDYNGMIKVLKEQVKSTAKEEDYHRAAMLKDRIKELQEEMEKAKE
jgi:predicted glycosyl hydrolase (DUF1957 family)